MRMWLTNYIAKSKKKNPSQGTVSASTYNDANLKGSSQYDNTKIVVPYGVVYNPPVGVTGVVLPLENVNTMIGVYSKSNIDLKPGEVMLYSAGGAKLVLRNNGNVEINGKVV